MRELKRFHPLVSFVYFAAVITLSVLFLHPVCRALSFVAAAVNYALLSGGRALAKRFLWLVPLILLTALLNPAFNHAGVTILTYLPSGNPLTEESIVYGVAAGMMIAGVILWFSSFHVVMTTDKFLYLFGRILPALSLLLSMTLRFVPRFTAQYRAVREAQEGMGKSLFHGSLIARLRCAASILSAMLTWTLEGSIHTADSMRARGYGLPGRTAFSVFTVEKRDVRLLAVLFSLLLFLTAGMLTGQFAYSFFPYRTAIRTTVFSLSLYTAYGMLCFLPVCMELREVIRWRSMNSGI